MFPVFDRAMQIPTARFQVRFRIEKLFHLKTGDLIFTRPFVSRFFAYLHKPAFSVAAMFSRIKAALAPNDRFHQHGIEMMFNRDAANQSIVLLKPRRTHPFVERVNRIPRSHCEVSKDRKSTRLNSSHTVISYAVFCLKKKNTAQSNATRPEL